MHKWHVDILLKDRDQVINCIWNGPENNSTAVANAILTKNRPQDFIGMHGLSDRHNVLIKVGEIVLLDISPIE